MEYIEYLALAGRAEAGRGEKVPRDVRARVCRMSRSARTGENLNANRYLI